jgi:hypothetical protein
MKPNADIEHLTAPHLKRGDMHLVCSDLEGVFVPEIWINVAERFASPLATSPITMS